MMFGIVVDTPAASEPVTLADAKAFARIDHNDDDAIIENRLIPAARDWAERLTNRQLVSATLKAYFDAFPSGSAPLYLPRPPLTSVTSVKYYDSTRTQQTLSSALYSVITAIQPGCIETLSVWPCTYSTATAIEVKYVCGYATTAAIPADIKLAILQIVAHMYEHRELIMAGMSVSEVPFGALGILQANRVPEPMQ